MQSKGQEDGEQSGLIHEAHEQRLGDPEESGQEREGGEDGDEPGSGGLVPFP
jgi:hypothetical protein